MILRLRQLASHVLMLQFVMQDLLEREDIEQIAEIVKNQTAKCNTQQGRTIFAIREQLNKLSEDEKKRKAAEKKAAKLARRGVTSNLDATTDHHNQEQSAEFSRNNEHETGSGSHFGKSYDFSPYLTSLTNRTPDNPATERARCSFCNKQPKGPYRMSCGHLICGEPCLDQVYLESAEQGQDTSVCKACGSTYRYAHPCDLEEVISPRTRKERKRDRSDEIPATWLDEIGDDVLPSAKTIAVKAQVINWIKENPNVKIIIYTQFLAM